MSKVRTLMNHSDPRVAAMYRALAGNTPRGKAARGIAAPLRTGRSNSTSRAGSSDAAAGTRKVEGSATKHRAAEPGRFAHFAGITLPAPAVSRAEAPTPAAPSPLRRPMSRAEMAWELSAARGRVPGCDTAEKLAAFVDRAGAKAHGTAEPAARGKPDMDTPEGVAAFVLSAGRRAGVVK